MFILNRDRQRHKYAEDSTRVLIFKYLLNFLILGESNVSITKQFMIQ